jgi:copper homeostasis protein (lipoprotein)
LKFKYLIPLPLFLCVVCAHPAVIAAASPPGREAAVSAAGASTPGLDTPGTWSGEVPCADCPAIRMTLTLRPDGVFLLRHTYVGADEGRDRSLVDRGRWERSVDGGRLTLRGGTEGPRQFAVLAPDRLRMLDAAGNEIRSQLNYELTRAATVDPIADRARLRGTFTYMADAARYVDCLTGQDLPVAMTADYLALERAYLAARGEPGSSLLVTLEGHMELRPGMEGDALVETLVVEKFDHAWPGESCGPTIEGKTWRLTELPGQSLAAIEPERAPSLTLDPATRRASGSAGCNRFSGTYELHGNTLRFGPLATTRMACPPEIMAVEDALLKALAAETAWSLQDGTLVLTREGQLVARFAAGAAK